MQEGWKAAVYAFFKPTVTVEYRGKRVAHCFACAKPGCKNVTARYQDTGDSTSTKNLCRHVERCWGMDILKEADMIADVTVARPVVEAYGRTGTITQHFERIGKGKVTYSIRQHTATQTR